MKNEYRIEETLIGKLIVRDLSRMLILIVINEIIFFSLFFLNSKPVKGPVNPLYFTFIMLNLIMIIIFMVVLPLKKRIYRNTVFIVDDRGIQKLVDFEQFGNPGFISGIVLRRSKQMSPDFNIFLQWSEVCRVKEKKHRIILLSANASSFYGTGQIIIPKEIQNFNQLRAYIDSKVPIS